MGEADEVITNFTITKHNLESFLQRTRDLFTENPNGLFLANIMERKSKRSIDQNSRYWKLLTELGRHIGYTSDELHDICRFKFLRSKVEIEGEPLPLMKSTTKLTVAEFGEYMQAIETWASDLGFYFEDVS